MAPLTPVPRRVYGLSLSAGPLAGDDSWLCRGTPGQGGVRVESVDALREIPGGARERTPALRNLLARLPEVPRSVWGVDVRLWPAPRCGQEREGPFAGEGGSVSGAADPRAVAPARRSEAWEALLERATTTPLERIEEMAEEAGPWILLREFVAPLSRLPGVAVFPFDPLPLVPAGAPPAMLARVPAVWVFEVSPARLLEGLERPVPSDAEEREDCLRELVQRGMLRPMPRALRRRGAACERSFRAVLAAAVAAATARREDLGEIRARPGVANTGFAFP